MKVVKLHEWTPESNVRIEGNKENENYCTV